MTDVTNAQYKDGPARNSKMEQLLGKLPRLKDHFVLEGKIGEGTFSSVYLAKGRERPSQKYAIKHLIPTCHPSRITRELKCMYQLGGKDNIVEVVMCLHVHDCIVFVMPYLAHDKFSNYIKELSLSETQLYMRELLRALRRVHAHNIIHRDIKPSNFLFNREEKRFLLVDFGLAQNTENLKMGNGENVIVKTENGNSIKKRKRDCSEDLHMLPMVKRPALQQLSNNVSQYSWEDAKNSSVKKSVSSPALSSVSPKDGKLSFVRVHNSQVKSMGPVFAKPLPMDKGKVAVRCHCDGRPRVCNVCITRKPQQAPRAGTPGFRPPEVLLKYLLQTTAVDMWAAGIIMLCLLSSTHPFFRSPDDMTALAELITIFGSKEIKDVATKLGSKVVCSEDRRPLDLRKLCARLRRREEARPAGPDCDRCKAPTDPEDGCLCRGRGGPPRDDPFPEEAYHLLARLLELDPHLRVSASQALQHPFFKLHL